MLTRKHGIKIHSYADDRQLYLSFDISDDVSECVKKLEQCVDKTEVLVISTAFFTDRLHETHITIGDGSIQACESARNPGVIFDDSLEMLITSRLWVRYHLCNPDISDPLRIL